MIRRLGPLRSWAACCLVPLSSCLAGCTVRQELPPPVQPFTLTPDAPFRSRKIVAADVPIFRSPDELALAKVRLGVALRQELSGVDGISHLLAEMFIYAAPDLLMRREQALRNATPRQIQEAAQRYFHPDNVDFIVFGDARTLFPELRGTGSVDLFRLRDASGT